MSENADEQQRERYGEHPGEDWRVVARKDGEALEWGHQGIFDEICVDHWLHAEQVGDARLRVDIKEDGQVIVDVERGFYSEVRGSTANFKPV